MRRLPTGCSGIAVKLRYTRRKSIFATGDSFCSIRDTTSHPYGGVVFCGQLHCGGRGGTVEDVELIKANLDWVSSSTHSLTFSARVCSTSSCRQRHSRPPNVGFLLFPKTLAFLPTVLQQTTRLKHTKGGFNILACRSNDPAVLVPLLGGWRQHHWRWRVY